MTSSETHLLAEGGCATTSLDWERRWSRKQVIAFSCLYETDSHFLCFCLCEGRMKDICPTGSFFHRVQRSGVSTTLMTACNCSITHTNVRRGPPFPAKKNAFSLWSGLSIRASQPIAPEPLRCGKRKNNVIFMRGDMGCPPHYHSALVNGIFCPHSHESTRHLPVPPNWLFTVFQHRPIFHRPHFVVQSAASTNPWQIPLELMLSCVLFWQHEQLFFVSPPQLLSSTLFCFFMLEKALNKMQVRTNKVIQSDWFSH